MYTYKNTVNTKWEKFPLASNMKVEKQQKKKFVLFDDTTHHDWRFFFLLRFLGLVYWYFFVGSVFLWSETDGKSNTTDHKCDLKLELCQFFALK